MNVTLVVCTYNRADSLRGTLEALGAQRVPSDLSWEVVVVDNNSTDCTPAVVDSASLSFPASLRYVFEPRQGLSHARNTGIEHSKGVIVAFTDDDVLPQPDWVATIAASMDELDADVLGGRILPEWSSPVPRWLEGQEDLYFRLALMQHKTRLRLKSILEKGRVWGANMAFRREVFTQVGTFDTRLGITGTKLYRDEDTDLVDRALRAGCTVIYDPRLVVHHRIPQERLRRSYFRRLAFDRGEGQALLAGNSATRALLGAPLYRYRDCVVQFGRWLLALLVLRPDAFTEELDLITAAGRLRGHWKSYLNGKGRAHQ
jgi:glycosyltransferase involved in cell wall biosynthesis